MEASFHPLQFNQLVGTRMDRVAAVLQTGDCSCAGADERDVIAGIGLLRMAIWSTGIGSQVQKRSPS